MNDLGSIKITDVAVNVGGLQVLHDVNISASKGDLLALLGPNGAGKTTILRTMLGLVKPAKGTVKVAGASPGKGGAILVMFRSATSLRGIFRSASPASS
ncbi:putative corrinoid ABC transporter ATPase [Cutibacterium acnes HL037PA1]|nr:putative corrinoid ABC transporter ATPase [Cutibacterium acnes HL037PA1]